MAKDKKKKKKKQKDIGKKVNSQFSSEGFFIDSLIDHYVNGDNKNSNNNDGSKKAKKKKKKSKSEESNLTPAQKAAFKSARKVQKQQETFTKKKTREVGKITIG